MKTFKTTTNEVKGNLIKAISGEDYTTCLIKKENGNYAVLTRDNDKDEYNSFFRSFKDLEKAEKHYNMLAY